MKRTFGDADIIIAARKRKYTKITSVSRQPFKEARNEFQLNKKL